MGIVKDNLLLDLDYDEDSVADVDMNVVMTGTGRLVEVQATAEHTPFSVARMNSLVQAGAAGHQDHIEDSARIMRAVQEEIRSLKGFRPGPAVLVWTGLSSSSVGNEKPGPDSSGSC